MTEKKDFGKKIDKTIIKQEVKNIGAEAGVLKEKDKKDLEDRIIETLKNLNGKLTKKEIVALMNRVEVSKGLDGLKIELKKEKLLGNKEISDDVLKLILDLIKETKDITQYGIEKLKLEMSSLNETKEYDINKNVYFSSKFPGIQKFEESKLGKNIIIDIAGITLGVADSAMAIFKFLLGLIKDMALLPGQIIQKIKTK